MTKNTEINPNLEEDVLTFTEREHEIILYNDNVNTFDHVIETLTAACEHSYEQAEQCAYIVHFSGKCSVKRGSMKDLVPRCTKLLKAGLSAEIV